MDGSDDDEAPRVSLPETPPVKTKTLFHYFKATPGSKTKTDDQKSQVEKTGNIVEDAKTVKNSSSSVPEKSPARKKLKEDVKPNSIDKKSDPSLTSTPEPEQVESNTPKVRGITNFFNKLSKEEYCKELKRSIVPAVLTVRALVHSPEPPLEPVAITPAPKKTAPLPGKKQRTKKSNVSRSCLETDIISVMEVQEENAILPESFRPMPENSKALPQIVEPLSEAVKPLPENSKSLAVKSGKISSSLFKKKSGGCGLKRPREESKEEDSIDADFFIQVQSAGVCKIDKEKNVTLNQQKDKQNSFTNEPKYQSVQEQKEKDDLKNEDSVREDEKLTCIVGKDEEKAVSDSVTISREVEREKQKATVAAVEPKMKPMKPVIARSKEKAIKKSFVQRSETPDLSASDQDFENSPDKKLVQKISNRLFAKKKTGSESTLKPETVDNDSVDIDFSTAFKSDNLFKDVSTLQPVEKKNKALFKEKPPRPKPASKKKMTKQVLMYDSDSIDIDVLASFNAKTFCADAEVIPESDESSNAFSALMKKPLTIKEAQSISPTSKTAKPVSPPNNKENDKNQVQPDKKSAKDPVANNAFAMLMAIKPKTPTAAAHVETDDFKSAKPKCKGRQKKVKESELDKKSPRNLQVVTPESNKDAGSRVFARLMTAKSKSADGDMTASENDASRSFEGKTRPKGRRAKRVRASLSESKDSNVCTVNFAEGKSSTRNTFSNIIEGPKTTLTNIAPDTTRQKSKSAKEVVEIQDVIEKFESVTEESVIGNETATSQIKIVSDNKPCESHIPLKRKARGKGKSKTMKEATCEVQEIESHATLNTESQATHNTESHIATEPSNPSGNNAFAKLMASRTKSLAKVSAKNSEPNQVQISQMLEECSTKEPKDESKVTQHSAFSILMCPKSKVAALNGTGAEAMDVIEIGDSPKKEEPVKSKGKRGRPKPVELEDCDSSSNDFEQPQEVGRRSARIQKNSAETQKRKEMMRQLESDDDEVAEKINKKRKGSKSAKRQKLCSENEMISEEDDDVYVEKVIFTPNKKRAGKSDKKLASIFIMGKKATAIKVIEDPAKVAARQAFLHSSVPQTLINQMASREEENLLQDEYVPFPRISHVRQENNSDFWSLPTASLSLRNEDKSYLPKLKNGAKNNLGLNLDFTAKNLFDVKALPKIERLSVEQIYSYARSFAAREGSKLSTLKIFARYLARKLESDAMEEEARAANVSLVEIEEQRMLRGGRRRRRSKLDKKHQDQPAKPDLVVNETKFDPCTLSSMQWTMKYAPHQADDIIGNEGTVRKLQSWLGEWEARDLNKRKKRRRQSSSSNSDSDQSSSSDFTSSEDEDDDNSADGVAKLPNTALLLGPSGVGKTSAVYALAREMGFKVLEVNASMGRSGKQVLSNLREATQSHNVRKRHKHDEQKNTKQNKNSKQQISGKGALFPGAPNVTKLDKTAVILFEDIDIIFEDVDEGFYGAVNSLIATTKRPIILTSSNPCFLQSSRAQLLKHTPQAFYFKTVNPSLVAKHLQLISLCEGFLINLESIQSLIAILDNDISRSIVALHYWATSGDGSRQGILEPFRESETIADEISCNKIETLIFNSAKAQRANEKVAVQSGCPMPFVGLGDVEEWCANSNILLNDPNTLKVLFEHGFVGLFEFNMLGLLALPLTPKPIVSKKGLTIEGQNGKTFSRIKKPFLEDDFFTTGNDPEIEGVSSQTGSQEPEVTSSSSQSQTSSSPNLVSQPDKPEPEPTKQDRFSRQHSLKALSAISDCLELKSSFFTTQHDASPWWTTGQRTYPNNSNFQPEIASYISEHTLSSSRQSISKILNDDPSAKKNLSIYSENLTIIDEDSTLFTTAVRCKEEIEGSKHRDSVCQVQREVLNTVLPDLTLNVGPQVIDLLPTLRFIVKAEEFRRVGGLSAGSNKRSRTGRFLHYFQAQGIHLKDQTLQHMCTALQD